MLLFLTMIDSDSGKETFVRVYDEYKGLMFYEASKILHNDEDAEDAVQEAFIAIAKNISKISEPVCPKTKSFVVIIVRRKALNILKRRKTEAEYDDEIAFAEDYKKASDIDSLLEKCLQMLPDKYREVLLLKYQFGYDLREIAEMMDITLQNAQKTDQRAKAKLKAIARKEGYDI